jgi:hypothetical protein
MKAKHSAPSARQVVVTTISAVGNLGACFAGVVDRGSAGLTMLMVVADMVLIGCSVLCWYLYFRALLDFRIEQLRQTPTA